MKRARMTGWFWSFFAFVTLGSPLLAASVASTRLQTFTYKQVNGLAIKADVMRPDDEIVRPVVIWIHGGALIMGSRKGVPAFVTDAFTSAGYAVVSIDYRLAPETKLPEIIQDLEDAYDWVRREGPGLFNVSTEKIGVLGGSAGGYLTLMSGFSLRPRPAVLVALYGYGDITGSWYAHPSEFYRRRPLVSRDEAYQVVGDTPTTEGSGNRGRFYLYCRQQGLWPKEVAGFDPVSEIEKFRPYSPVLNVTADYPPTLLIHGTADTDVPYEQSVLMDRELTRHGVTHELITIEGAGHGLHGGDQDAVKKAHDHILEFVQQHLPRP